MKNKDNSNALYVLILILFVIYWFSKIEQKKDNQKEKHIIGNNIKTVGIISKYSRHLYKGTYIIVDFNFTVNNEIIIIKDYNYSVNIFPTCEKDGECIGRKFAVYYLPKDPKKYNVPVFEEEIP